MEIKIDRQTIDFSLEKETTVGEVISGIEQWLSTTGLFISMIKVNREELQLEDRGDWQRTPLERVKEIDVSTETQFEQQYEALDTVSHYFNAFYNALKNKQYNAARELHEESGPVIDYLSSLLGVQKEDSATPLSQFQQLIASSGIPDGVIKKEENAQQLMQYTGALIILIRERMNEIAFPVEELRNLMKLLVKTNEEIKDVSLLLQTGKDREAMDLVVRFTELSQKLLRIIHILDISALAVDGRSLQEFYQELNGFFQELHEAFELDDSVLIGDVFEYEIAPRIEKLIACMEGITAQTDTEE